MENVDFLDSTGLGVLVGGLKKVRAHDGSLQLICTQERLLKIFRITGLAKVFTIHATAEAAARRLTPSPSWAASLPDSRGVFRCGHRSQPPLHACIALRRLRRGSCYLHHTTWRKTHDRAHPRRR